MDIPYFCNSILNQVVVANQHSLKKILHFKRWSNASYAVFHSLGKIVHIGFLSKIIHGLLTIKSIISLTFLKFINNESENEIVRDDFIDQFSHEGFDSTFEIQLIVSSVYSNRIERSDAVVTAKLLYTLFQGLYWAFFILLYFPISRIIKEYFINKNRPLPW